MRLVVFLFLALFLLSGIVMVQREVAALELIRMGRPINDPGFLADYYLPVPHLGTPVAGSPDAPIAFVIQMDPATEEARYFKREIYPRLEAEYIETGIVKYYEKRAITSKDIVSWTPEEVYDREWAETLMGECLTQLRAELSEQGKEVYYRAFEAYDLATPEERPTYGQIAESLGLKVHDVRNHLTHVRSRLRELIVARIREYVTSRSDLMKELQDLTGLFQG